METIASVHANPITSTIFSLRLGGRILNRSSIGERLVKLILKLLARHEIASRARSEILSLRFPNLPRQLLNPEQPVNLKL
jgi:hypothetical protein